MSNFFSSMNLYLENEKFKLYKLNEIIWDDDYIDWVISQEKIDVIDNDGKHSWYMTVESEPFIVMPKRFKGIKRRFNFLHELAHHFTSFGRAPNQAYFHGVAKTKEETMCDEFALLALIPHSVLSKGENAYLEDHPASLYAKQYFRDRKRLQFWYDSVLRKK